MIDQFNKMADGSHGHHVKPVMTRSPRQAETDRKRTEIIARLSGMLSMPASGEKAHTRAP